MELKNVNPNGDKAILTISIFFWKIEFKNKHHTLF
jgi:hypothetical protein